MRNPFSLFKTNENKGNKKKSQGDHSDKPKEDTGRERVRV